MKNMKFYKIAAMGAFMAGALSGCYMDSYRDDPINVPPQIIENPPEQVRVERANSGKVAREPIQQVAPGPTRKAAPPIPVM